MDRNKGGRQGVKMNQQHSTAGKLYTGREYGLKREGWKATIEEDDKGEGIREKRQVRYVGSTIYVGNWVMHGIGLQKKKEGT